MAYPSASVTQSGINWATFQQSGFAGLLEALITANLSATLAPTVACTLSTTGSSGTLTAATYYVVSTETNAFGETTVGPVSSGQAISSTLELVITPPSLKTGNTARNYYWGTSNTGPFTLLSSGQTGSSTTILAMPPTNSYAVAPPTINTTGLTFVDASGLTKNKALDLIRKLEHRKAQDVIENFSTTLRDFLRGDPMPLNDVIQKLNYVRGAAAIFLQACNESGTLIDANAGTLGNSSTLLGNTFPKPQRTWP